MGNQKNKQESSVVNTNICSESSLVGVISKQRGWVKSRLLPDGLSSSEGSLVRTLHPHLLIQDTSYIKFCQVNYSRQFHPRTEPSNFIVLTFLHHLVREAQESSIPGNPFSILLREQFCNLTCKEFMIWRLQDSNQNTSSVSNTGYR